jgi:hypothetical protein
MQDHHFTARLGPGQALTLPAAASPRRLVVTAGRLWLTRAGSADDHWLHVGEGLTLAPGQIAVVEGWPAADFQLLQPAPLRRVAPGPGAIGRLAPVPQP